MIVLRTRTAHNEMGVVGAALEVGDAVLGKVRLPQAEGAGMVLLLNADTGTIVVGAVAGNVGEEGRENMDFVDSRGKFGDGVTKAEECKAFHAVVAHCEEV